MKILIVDDDADAREFLGILLRSQHHLVEAAVDGKEALLKIRANAPDLVISDILMPLMDGFTLCHEIRRDPEWHNLPLIFYTGTYLEPAHEKLAMALGATAFITKPQEPDRLLQVVENILTAGHATIPDLPDDATIARTHTDVVVEKLAEKVQALQTEVARRVAMEATLQESKKILRTSLIGTVVAFSHTVGVRDPFAATHQQRVSRLAREIAQQMQLSPEQIDGLRMGAMIHDIGKIYLPAEILNKPGKLGTMEYELVKTHCQVGYDILKDVVFPWPIANIAHQHHERMDGSGYPQGLGGEEICLEARIVGLADVAEAMMSHHTYRPAHSQEVVLAEIQRGSGSEYDAEVAAACLYIFEAGKFSFK